ncbi:MAG: hypothetical protein WCO79_00710 [bacterium]
MKKFLSILVLVVLVTPQVAMAAWWNPFSWSVFQKKEANVQQLEVRIKELEKKLEAASTTEKVVVPKPVVVEKKSVKKVVPVVEEEVAPVVPKTFVLPNGSVVDVAGNVVSAAPVKDDKTIGEDYFNEHKTCAGLRDVQPNSYSFCVDYALNKVDVPVSNSQSVQGDKFTGENYFKEHKTCAGLKDVNANQHSFCISYALNGDNSFDSKQSRLNAINLKIANLNAKYAKDLAAARTQGSSTDYSEGLMRYISIQYNIDYAALMAEFQQIQYSN